MFHIFKSAPKNYEDLDEKTFRTKLQSALKAELLNIRTAGDVMAEPRYI